MMHGQMFIERVHSNIAAWFFRHPEYNWNGIIFTVSYYKELQNSKGTFAGGGDNQILFEATYNGDTDELYLNAYDKIDSITYDNGATVED